MTDRSHLIRLASLLRRFDSFASALNVLTVFTDRLTSTGANLTLADDLSTGSKLSAEVYGPPPTF